jgi:hypothetical protein
MKSLVNFLQWLNDNWSAIIVVIGLIVALVMKIKSYLKLSNQEKIEIAYHAIKQRILTYVSDAEKEYEKYKKAGSIKRAEVIDKIYKEYPILNKVADQTAVTTKLDELIDDALVDLRAVIEKNS